MNDCGLAEFRAQAEHATSLVELNIAFRRCARHFGFTAYAVGFVPSPSQTPDPFLLLDWPRSWLELYAREGFAREDAVVARASVTDVPFTWADVQTQQPGASARIFAAARDFGWIDGLLVPIRANGNPQATRVGVASLASPKMVQPDLAGSADVIEASTIAFQRAAALAKVRRSSFLTEREREIMALVAVGLGDREIGLRLGISASTAHFHVEQVKKKLGASSRAGAIAVAMAEGLVR